MQLIWVPFYSFYFLFLSVSVTGRNFKIGLLAPFSPEYEFSGITSASAVTLAIERIHADPYLNANGLISLRLVKHLNILNKYQ